MDPIFVANEGKLIAIVPPDSAEAVWRLCVNIPRPTSHHHRSVVEQHPGMLVARTGIGGTRVVAMQIGEQLPRTFVDLSSGSSVLRNFSLSVII